MAFMNETLASRLRLKAAELGFTMLGIVAAAPAQRLDAYLRWVARGMYGAMGYMARPDRVQRRQDLQVILPGARSLICVGLPYFTRRLPTAVGLPTAVAHDPARGRIANYAWGADYHDVMTPRLQELAAWLIEATGAPARQRVYVDTGAILERDHAETAALGFTGKNTMLIHPRRGSWFFLGEILTTVRMEHGGVQRGHGEARREEAMPGCGSCQRCLTACPTHAFPEPYVLDARRCISYLTIELKGWIPRDLRPLMGNWIYGCDICQDVCPFNRFAQPTDEMAFYPEAWRLDSGAEHTTPHFWDAAAPPLLDILQMDEAEFARRFAHTPVKRIRRERLLRNACVAAGNWGSATAVPALISLLPDPSPLLRGHAAWALWQIGTEAAQTAVAHAATYETDPHAHAEMTQPPIFNR